MPILGSDKMRTQEIYSDPQSMTGIAESVPSVTVLSSLYESEEPMSVDGDGLTAFPSVT
jgi:hypothetical protein